MQFQAVLFDFDGVLGHSEPLHHRVYAALLRELGQELAYAEFTARYIHLDDPAVFRAVAKDRGLGWAESRVQELAARARERFLAAQAGQDIFYPGMADLVRRLAQALPLAVVSMGDRQMIENALTQAGVTACFSGILAAGEVTRPKPDPAPYLRGLELLNRARGSRITPAACAAVEDSGVGVRSGKAAGMTVLAVLHNQSEVVLREAGADRLFATVAELAAFLSATD